MRTVMEAWVEIEARARATAAPEVRRVARHAVGAVARQGDVYLHAVAADHPGGARTQERQLVPGATQGSRHVAVGAVEVRLGTTLPPWVQAPPGVLAAALLGPLLRVRRRAVVTHPEHAHVSLPVGTWQVTYQLDARTRQRVQD